MSSTYPAHDPPKHYWEDPSTEHYAPCGSFFQSSLLTLLSLSSLSLLPISIPCAQLANFHNIKSMLQHFAVTDIILAICILWFWRLPFRDHGDISPFQTLNFQQ